MTVRPDNRLADAPMRPVGCGTCGARVLVRKASWEQTSVQWSAAARQRCVDPHRHAGQTLSLCPQLRTAIENAVLEGAVPVLAESEDANAHRR
ncbi:hypothetical protein NLB33_15920 [Mycolicibacterium smegmatis]|uniref:hypothetical protein n=1 Tax=Mycolicibacterium smegmatis TaxID=1772 RepID=UPI0020A5D62B|nr:hypothetical protein [Mycolicibacterium smegmatis]MCP2624339.1 hypothetical protein [Mycolicibacterium smegmatis]